MKKIILAVIILLVTFKSNSQGFASISSQGFFNERFNSRFGINTSVGLATSGQSTIGISTDFFVFGKLSRFVVPHLEAKIFFKDMKQKDGTFISLQPGWVIFDKLETKGNLAYDIIGGVYLGKVVFSAGFSFISFKTRGEITSYPGGKIQFGIKF